MAVYFIQAGEDGPVKIGWAAEPEKRRASLQCGQAATLRLIRVVQTSDRMAEKLFQRQFGADRIRGEWFLFNPLMMTAELQLSHGRKDDFRAALEHLSLSQKKFAEMTGRRVETVSRWATGNQPVPRIIAFTIELLQYKASLNGEAA